MDNLYQPPSADLSLPEDRPGQSPFFVTSTGKLMLLFLLTMGMYSIYWFYKHWDTQKRIHNEAVMPAARAIFQILFAHSLFKRIATAYETETGKLWKYNGMAWLFVAASIVSQLFERMSNRVEEFGMLDIVHLAILPIMMLPLYLAQKHANIAVRDPLGARNRNISLLNWLFIVPFGLLWIVILLGFAVSTGLLPDGAIQGVARLFSLIPGHE